MKQTNAKKQVTLEIDALSYGPCGIGRSDRRVVMVPHSAPGDTIVARLAEEHRRFAVGELVRLVTPGAVRRTPPCPYAGRCGGCSWQHLQYPAQIEAKQQSVDDALRRIGKLTGYDLRPIIPAAREYSYRRRLRLQVGPANELGLYGASSHDLVEIASCLIADERLNRPLETLRRWMRGVKTAIEHMEIVTGDEPEETVVVLRASGPFSPPEETGIADLVGAEAGVAGLIAEGGDGRNVWGEPRITLHLEENLNLRVDADVFTQVNPEGNRRLLQELIAAGDFHRDDRVLELFCGAGNFTLSLARRVAALVAVDGDRRAIQNARLNAQCRGVDNIRWICAPVPPALARLSTKQRERFTKIVLDPPRAGAKGLAEHLAAFGAEKILYVSCDPTTMARDLAALAGHGYELRTAQPVDLFPQTFHVETLATLERS